MDFRFVSPGGLREADAFELDDMLLNEEGFVWIDIPGFSDADRRFLSDRFGFHPVALDITASRNHMPMVHGYADHVFAVLHRPVVIDVGHVHLVEIDMFLGQRYLVTVHPAKELDPKSVSEVDETHRPDQGRPDTSELARSTGARDHLVGRVAATAARPGRGRAGEPDRDEGARPGYD
jgi:Mg2+ and Co2+ transporters